MTYSNLNRDPDVLKIENKYDDIEELKNRREKHDYEIILKSLKIDIEDYKKVFKSLHKNKNFLIATEILIFGFVLTVDSVLSSIGFGSSI